MSIDPIELPNITAAGGWCGPSDMSWNYDSGPYVPPTADEQRATMNQQIIRMRNVLDQVQAKSANIAAGFYNEPDPNRSVSYLREFDDFIDDLEETLQDGNY